MTNVNGSRKPESPYEMEKSQTPTTVRSYGVAQYDYKVLLQFFLQINENFMVIDKKYFFYKLELRSTPRN